MNSYIILMLEITAIAFYTSYIFTILFAIWYRLKRPPYGLKEGKLELVKHG